MLLMRLLQAGSRKPRTQQDQLALLVKAVQPLLQKITQEVHRSHPNKSLEPLMESLFKTLPGVTYAKEQGGTHDGGADVIVVYEHTHPLTGQVQRRKCVVQVKSFEGLHWRTDAVSDIRRAFDRHPDADEGLIVSTADQSTEALEIALDELRDEHLGRPVSLLIGEDVALFLIRFAWKSFATMSSQSAAE